MSTPTVPHPSWSTRRIIGALLLVASISIALFWLSNARSSSRDPLIDKLPLRRQFPLATINRQDFERQVGWLPKVAPQTFRPYGLFVLFSMRGVRQPCPMCQLMEGILRDMTRQFSAADRIRSKTHFAYVEFEQNPDLFQRLEIKMAPLLLYLPAITADTDAETYNQSIVQFPQEMVPNFASVLSFIQKVEPTFQATESARSNRNKIIGTLAVLALLIFAITAYPSMIPICYKALIHPIVMAVGSTLIVLTMCAGYQWVRIRNAPFRPAPDAKPSAGLQAQFGFEAQEVFLCNAASTAALTLLAAKVPAVQNRLVRFAISIAAVSVPIIAYHWQAKLLIAKSEHYQYTIF